MSNDVTICAKSRKVVIASGIDISRIRVRVTRGLIHLQGTVSRMGEDAKEPEANAPYLEKLDQSFHRMPGFRGISYTFDNWRLDTRGSWQFIGKKVRGAKRH